jgi:hypothetical protein
MLPYAHFSVTIHFADEAFSETTVQVTSKISCTFFRHRVKLNNSCVMYILSHYHPQDNQAINMRSPHLLAYVTAHPDYLCSALGCRYQQMNVARCTQTACSVA